MYLSTYSLRLRKIASETALLHKEGKPMDSKYLVELGKCRVDECRFEEAYPYFLEGSLADDSEAIKQLAQLYLYGDGVKQDYKKAFHYFRIYYDLSEELGCIWPIMSVREDVISSSVGRNEYSNLLDYLISKEEWPIYIIKADEYSKDGIYPQNPEKKLECLNTALINGIRFAAEAIGQMYCLGDEISRDYQKAYDYFTMYEGDESFVKPYFLGEMYLNGDFVEQDIEKAKQLFEKIVDSDVPMKSMDDFYYMAAERLQELRNLDGEWL